MNDPFRPKYVELTATTRAAVTLIKNQALDLYQTLDEQGQSREISLAKTKLEEAVMWAVKHVSAPERQV